jgi:hypothetical protein
METNETDKYREWLETRRKRGCIEMGELHDKDQVAVCHFMHLLRSNELSEYDKTLLIDVCMYIAKNWAWRLHLIGDGTLSTNDVMDSELDRNHPTRPSDPNDIPNLVWEEEEKKWE